MTSFLNRVSLIVALALSAVALAPTSHANVVFGNLGASGTGSLGGTNTDYGPADTDEISLAQGFSTNASPWLTISSIKVGLFVSDATPANRTVSIWSNSGGVPGTSLFTSQAVSVGSTGSYTFPFTGATLSGSSTYWVVPEGPASWYLAPGSIFALPTAQNGSGYSSVDALVLSSTSSNWESSQLKSYSIAINAVPEPSTLVAAGSAVVACGGTLVLRRRKKRA